MYWHILLASYFLDWDSATRFGLPLFQVVLKWEMEGRVQIRIAFIFLTRIQQTKDRIRILRNTGAYKWRCC